MKRHSLRIGGCLALALAAVLAVASASSAQATLTASGGGVGGVWYRVMAGVAQIAQSAYPEIKINVVPGGGVGNTARLGAGKVELAMVFPPFVAAAREGRDPYKERYGDVLMAMGGFGINVLHFAVALDAGLPREVDQILRKGARLRIVTGRKATSTGWLFGQMINSYGLTERDIERAGGKVMYTDYADWVNLIKDKNVDAMFDNIAYPTPILQEALLARKMTLLHLPPKLRSFLAEKIALAPDVIPKGTYGEMPQEDIRTVSTSSAVAVHRKVPDEVVYKIVKAVSENLPKVYAIHKSLNTFRPENAWKDLGGPLHPGAARYYREKGYMK